MALLASVQGLLDHLTATEGPAMWELPLEQTRRNADASAALLSPGDSEPVGDVYDRQISGRDGSIGIRVYTPTSVGPYGILVYFHGGGYVLCSLETHDGMCRRLCNLGDCIVVSIDYRLAPEHPFPAGVTDAIDATVWVQDHAAELGGVPERVGVGGDSAGGNFAAVVALALANGVSARGVTARGVTARGVTANQAVDRPPLVLQVLLYPGVDRAGGYASLVENGEGYLLTSAMRNWFRDCYVPPDADLADWRLSPMRAPSHSEVAPAVVITAQYDPLRDEGNAYADKLRAAGVAVEHRCVPGVIHGFLQYGAFIPEAAAELERVGARVRQAFR